MPMNYWLISGIGLNSSKLRKLLNKEKLVNFLHEKLPNNEEITDMIRNRNYDGLFIEMVDRNDNGDQKFKSVNFDEILYDNFDGFIGGMLVCYTGGGSFTFCDNGSGEEYFFYMTSMPWNRSENEPRSIDEVRERIINAVQKFTNLSRNEIGEMINNDLYIICCG